MAVKFPSGRELGRSLIKMMKSNGPSKFQGHRGPVGGDPIYNYSSLTVRRMVPEPGMHLPTTPYISRRMAWSTELKALARICLNVVIEVFTGLS